MGTDARWTNWFGNVSVMLDAVTVVHDEDEIVSRVRHAVESGTRVRAHGAGHSNTSIVTSGGTLLDLRPMAGLRSIDRDAGTATFGAATTVASIGPLLWAEGLSLANQGDTNAQFLAGAVSTATHGTGVELGSFSGSVVAARLITGAGQVREIDEREPELLRAVRTSLGTLGILSEITVRVLPAFNLSLEFEDLSWDAALARWDEEILRNRHFTIYWCPDGTNEWIPGGAAGGEGSERVVFKTMNPSPADDGTVGTKGSGTFVAPAWQVWPDDYLPDYHEFEYMIPIEYGKEAASRIRDLMRREHPDEVLPVEIRFCGPDDAMLSPLAGRQSCVISVSGRMGADNDRYFADCDRILADYGARPHWGKAHRLDVDRLRAVYPEFDRFLEIRRQLDPAGAFLTDAALELFGL